MDNKPQEMNPGEINLDQIKTTVTAAGSGLDERIENDRKTNESCCAQPLQWFPSPHAYLFGILAAFAIVGIYLIMNTLTSD